MNSLSQTEVEKAVVIHEVKDLLKTDRQGVEQKE